MGPEGSEGTSVLNVSPTNEDFNDVSPLAEKQAFMQAGVPNSPNLLNLQASSIMSGVSIPSSTSMQQFYLDDEEMGSWKPSTPVSSWASPFELMTEEDVTKRVLESATSNTFQNYNYENVGMPRRTMSNWAQWNAPATTQTQTHEMHPLMVAGLKFGLKPDEIAKIVETQDQSVWGSYHPYDDVMKMNVHPGDWYTDMTSGYGVPYDTQKHQMHDKADWVGTPFHELVGHRLLNQLEYENFGQSVWDDAQKRALEDVASQTDTFSAPGYFTPFATKREDFLSHQMPDVQALYETGGSQISPEGVAPYGFDPSQGEMITSRAATVEDLLNLNAPIHSDTHGWYEGTGWENFANFMAQDKTDWATDYNPNQNLTNLEELGYDKELARRYENWERFNQELPPQYLGGDPSSPLNVSYDIHGKPRNYTGLAGWPLGHEHFLVDRIIARNPKLSGSGEKKGLTRAITNELNAAMANPNSVLSKISKLGLADKFWDYVEEYISTESDDWSPSRAKEEIQKLLGG